MATCKPHSGLSAIRVMALAPASFMSGPLDRLLGYNEWAWGRAEQLLRRIELMCEKRDRLVDQVALLSGDLAQLPLRKITPLLKLENPVSHLDTEITSVICGHES